MQSLSECDCGASEGRWQAILRAVVNELDHLVSAKYVSCICQRWLNRLCLQGQVSRMLQSRAFSERHVPPSSSGLGRCPFTAVTRVRIPLGVRKVSRLDRLVTGLNACCSGSHLGPVAQLVSAPPCHGGGRGFESRRGRCKIGFRL